MNIPQTKNSNIKLGNRKLPSRTDLNLVLLHGWGMNQGIWSDFSVLLRDELDINVTCLDLPGFGLDKDVSLSEYSIETMSLKVAAQLPDNCVLLGWSLGGLVSQFICNHMPEKVLANIQICSSPKFRHEDSWPGIKPEVLVMFMKQLQSNHEALLKRFLAIQCMGLVESKLVLKTMMASLTSFPLSTPEALLASLHVLDETDLRHDLTILDNKPCLKIFGGLDSLVPASVVPKIKVLSPTAQIEILPKASHAPFISHPEATLGIISRFVDSLILKV